MQKNQAINKEHPFIHIKLQDTVCCDAGTYESFSSLLIFWPLNGPLFIDIPLPKESSTGFLSPLDFLDLLLELVFNRPVKANSLLHSFFFLAKAPVDVFKLAKL